MFHSLTQHARISSHACLAHHVARSLSRTSLVSTLSSSLSTPRQQSSPPRIGGFDHRSHVRYTTSRSTRDRISNTLHLDESACPTVISEFPAGVDVTERVTDEAFENVMEHLVRRLELRKRVQENKTFAIGVSGGADSMALLLLTQRWARKHGYRTVALIVDHDLRPESEMEANVVTHWAQSIGINEIVVKKIDWKEERPDRSVLELHARTGRYEVFNEECAKRGIDVLLTGHHMQDTVESFIMRSAFGSGIHGLAGIPFIKDKPMHVAVGRPLIAFTRTSLMATCKFFHQKWIEDPSNYEPDTARNLVRQHISQWKQRGVPIERLAQTMHSIVDVRSVLVHQMTQFFFRSVRLDKMLGYATIDRRAFQELPPELGAHVLSNVIQWVTNARYTPVTQALFAIKRFPSMKGGTNYPTKGSYLHIAGRNIYVVREHLNNNAEMPPLRLKFGESGVWDRRFFVKVDQYDYNQRTRKGKENMSHRVVGGHGKPQHQQYQNVRIPSYDGTVDTDPETTLIVRRLTKNDWSVLANIYPPIKNAKSKYPSFLRHSLPVIVHEQTGEIWAVPFIGYKAKADLFFEVHFESWHHNIPLVEYEYLPSSV